MLKTTSQFRRYLANTRLVSRTNFRCLSLTQNVHVNLNLNVEFHQHDVHSTKVVTLWALQANIIRTGKAM